MTSLNIFGPSVRHSIHRLGLLYVEFKDAAELARYSGSEKHAAQLERRALIYWDDYVLQSYDCGLKIRHPKYL